MKISTVRFPQTSFGAALTGKQEKDFNKTVQKALKVLGKDDGVRIFKVYQTALPCNENENLGIGRLNSQAGIDYLKFMALYTGSNAIKVYPDGRFPSPLRFNNYYCPYERFSTVTGIDNINFFKLCGEEYGKLLSKNDIQPYLLDDNLNSVDYENELELKNGADEKLIKTAYENMQNLKTKDAVKIKNEFNTYKEGLKTDVSDRLAITPFIRETDSDLFKNFSVSPEKQQRFEDYKEKYAKEIDIYKFTSFLAEKNIAEAKRKLNAEGLDLYGDCPIGFAQEEVFAFPDAFYPENISPGWGFRAIKYDEISKEGTEANKLFKEKISRHLKNYDGIRFDVGWQYFNPKFTSFDENGKYSPFYMNIKEGAIIEFIEKTAKEIKGENYDTKKIMYECDAGPADFSLYDWNDGKPTVRNIMKNRTPVLTTVYESETWGSPLFHKNAGLEDFMTGTNNHDGTPLRRLAEDEKDDKGNRILKLEGMRKNNYKPLCKNLNLTEKYLSNPANFVKAKFAELFQTKNHFVFFNDVIGNKNRLDRETIEPENYRYKIPKEYEREFHSALQNNLGFNLPEILTLALKARNPEITNSELYKKLEHYGEYLKKKGALTKEEAEKSEEINKIG